MAQMIGHKNMLLEFFLSKIPLSRLYTYRAASTGEQQSLKWNERLMDCSPHIY